MRFYFFCANQFEQNIRSLWIGRDVKPFEEKNCRSILETMSLNRHQDRTESIFWFDFISGLNLQQHSE